MPKTDTLIKNGEKRMNLVEADFKRSTKSSESAILAEIQKLFKNVDISNGKLKSNAKTLEFLMSLEARINDALKTSGYTSGVRYLLKNFDYIKQNNIEIQASLNKVNISEAAFNDITKLEIQNTVEKLTGSGISKDFVTPIRESLYRNIILGADVNEAEQTITDYIITQDGKDSKLLKYTSQVARDSISQYDGAIQTAIKNELDLPDFLYAGSLILDSRAQCRHWVAKTRLLGKDLQGEIETALANGSLGGKRCSGMIPATSLSTFSIYRGGYNCRHRALPTKF